MKAEYAKQALEALYALRDGVNKPPKHVGLCFYIDCHIYDGSVRYFISEAMERWPKHSGNLAYPISVTDMVSPSKQYHVYSNRRAMWDRRSLYGRLRWELLDFIIEELENENTD